MRSGLCVATTATAIITVSVRSAGLRLDAWAHPRATLRNDASIVAVMHCAPTTYSPTDSKSTWLFDDMRRHDVTPSHVRARAHTGARPGALSGVASGNHTNTAVWPGARACHYPTTPSTPSTLSTHSTHSTPPTN